MTKKAFKNISLVLVCLATLILTIDIIDMKMILGKPEIGLWDNMPFFVRKSMFLAYPIVLLASFSLFVRTRRSKTIFDKAAGILFLLNILGVLSAFYYLLN